jgi:hypothetical protein
MKMHGKIVKRVSTKNTSIFTNILGLSVYLFAE